MKTYQVRIGTDVGIQEYVYRVTADDMEDAEVEAINRASEDSTALEHEHIKYMATSVA